MIKKNDYLVCTQIVTKEKNNKEIDFLLIEYKKSRVEYDLCEIVNSVKIFSSTDLPANSLIDIIKVKKVIYYIYTDENKNLFLGKNIKKIINFTSRCIGLSINKKKININVIGFIKSKVVNLENFKIKYSLKVGSYEVKELKNVFVYYRNTSKIKKILNIKNYFSWHIDLDKIINNENEIAINNSVYFCIEINGVELLFAIPFIKKEKNPKYYSLPIVSTKKGNYCIYIRRTKRRNLVIVKREIENIEKTKKFKFYESKIMTLFFLFIGTIYKYIKKKKINLYFEKFASKAEEGVFELFEKARDTSKISKNYFIIEDTEENKKYLTQKNVVAKFSFKYYILLFASSNVIATESATHLNIIRSLNKPLEKSILNKKFIFLQHGIIYMKNLTGAAFSKNAIAYPDLFVVSSKKEAKIVNQMLEIPKERLIITGLAAYDKIKPGFIQKKSNDKVVIMLTWKEYEEQVTDITKTTYYHNTLNVYKILSKLIPEKNILIVPHPKVKDKMLNLNFGPSIFLGLISNAIEDAKLLITDYSSICYNCFYRGAGVIFYQQDLEEYEMKQGKLIPKDNEYIGYRCFNQVELTKILKKGIVDSKVNLDYFRTKKFIKNYKKINQFSDGKNIERIYNEIKQRKIV